MVWNRLFKLWQPLTDSGITKSSTSNSTNKRNTNYTPLTLATPTCAAKSSSSNSFANNFYIDQNIDTALSIVSSFNQIPKSATCCSGSSSTPLLDSNLSANSNPALASPGATTDSLNRVYPTQGSQHLAQTAFTFTSEMSRKNSSKKMGWREKSAFKPLRQEEDEEEDWNTDNNLTEEDVLLDQTDEEFDFGVGGKLCHLDEDTAACNNVDFSYGLAIDGFYWDEPAGQKKKSDYFDINEGEFGFRHRVEQSLFKSQFDKGKKSPRKLLDSGDGGNFSTSASFKDSLWKTSNDSRTRTASSGSGGSAGSCYGNRARSDEPNPDKKSQGRVIATPWGAAWIGKRKKGVTYCTPDQRKKSIAKGKENINGGKGKEGKGASGAVGGEFNGGCLEYTDTPKKQGEIESVSGSGSRSESRSGSGSGSGSGHSANKNYFSFGEKDIIQSRRKKFCESSVLENDDDDDDDEDWDMADHICDPNCPLLSHEMSMSPHSPALSAFSAQRRSSFTSSTSSKDSFTSQHHAAGRKPRHHLASLSIDDLAATAQIEYGGISGPIRSPGLLSTASMWSTSDLNQAGLKEHERSGGTNSLSNVSGSFNERMHELVRAFSERTQRTKEKISQPPTPSSESDLDAKSGTSAVNEPTGPRNIRLGSFLPLGSRTSEASDGNQDHFVGVWHCKFKMPRVLKKLKFPSTIEPHSKTYVSWLFIVTLAFMYNACVIPLRGVFPYQTPENVRYWLIADYFCDLIYFIDISVIKIRLRFASHGIVQCDRKETTKHYRKKWMFKFDVLSLTPLDLLYFIDGVGVNPWLRLCRLLKIHTFWEFYEKCDQSSRSSAPAIRIIKTMTYMLFLIHIETCGYYAVSKYEGIGTNQWVYNGQGIAYIRCFYLATKTATSIGNNPKPINELEFGFMTLYWLSGVFVFALLIGQIRDIVEAAGLVKDSYRKKMDACLWYMQSINMPSEMQNRVREWFLYNWDQQKTIDEQSLVCTLPRKLQTDLAINVHFQTLSKVQLFQDCEKNLLYDLVLKLKPILFLPGDYICKKGEVGKEMYIVTQGQVEVVGGTSNETVLATLYEGSVFGEISLLAMSGRGNRRTAHVRSKGYTNVFTLSKHDFEEAMTEYPEAQSLLKKRAKKLLKANAKMERKNKAVGAQEIIKTPSETPKLLRTVIQVMDPDSNLVKQLGSSIKKGSSYRRRPVSRSHSHRLSPSQSGLQHLTPPRSHSYRHHSSKSPNSSFKALSPLTKTHPTGDKQDLDSDDQEEELVFQESSDELSLSEVFQDAGATSSFEDDYDDDHDGDADNEDNNFDDEEDELLVIEQCDEEEYDGEVEREDEKAKKEEINVGCNEDYIETKAKVCWDEFTPSNEKETRQDVIIGDNGVQNSEPKFDIREVMEKAKLEPARIGVNEEKRLSVSDKEDGRSERSKGESTIPSEDSQDSGLPDVQRSDSRSSSGKKEVGREGNNGSKCNSQNSGRGSRCSMGSNADQPGTSSKNGENNKNLSSMPKKQLELGDSMEDYIEKQIFSNNESKQTNLRKSVSAHFSFTPETKLVDKQELTNRVRKLSVVTPPHSPAELKHTITNEKEITGVGHGHMWGSGAARSQVFTWKDNSSNNLKPFTPVETIHIRALPPIDSTPQPASKTPPEFYRHSASSIPSLANGLEGCCGGGPLVDIPPENRVICSVEIHRPKSSSSTTTTDIHGHIETSL